MSSSKFFGEMLPENRPHRGASNARALQEESLWTPGNYNWTGYRLMWNVLAPEGPRLGAGSIRIQKETGGQILVHAKRYCLGSSVADTPWIEQKEFETSIEVFDRFDRLIDQTGFWSANADQADFAGIEYWILEGAKAGGPRHLVFRGVALETLLKYYWYEEARQKRPDVLRLIGDDLVFGEVIEEMLNISTMGAFDAISGYAREEWDQRYNRQFPT